MSIDINETQDDAERLMLWLKNRRATEILLLNHSELLEAVFCEWSDNIVGDFNELFQIAKNSTLSQQTLMIITMHLWKNKKLIDLNNALANLDHKDFLQFIRALSFLRNIEIR